MDMGARAEIVRRPIPIAVKRALRHVTLAVFTVIAVAFPTTLSARAQSATPVAVSATPPTAEEQISRKYLIKAAILYNLAKFATWPEAAFSSATAPVRLCVLGQNPFGPALESLHGKRVGRRNLAVTTSTDVEYAPACHVLFVSDSEEHRLSEILDMLSKLPILTVADFGKFAAAGGIVGLTEVDDRSRLEVNVDAAGLAGVRLSSKLLRLAVTVDTQTAQLNAAPEK